MIAMPKTMYCIAVESPMISSIWVSRVSAIAAIHVEVALASPPESDAPAITTAAIGASRYAEPKSGVDADPHAREEDPRDRVERAGRHVGEDDMRPDVQTRHPRALAGSRRRPGTGGRPPV